MATPIDWYDKSFDEKVERLRQLGETEDITLFEYGDITRTFDDPEYGVAAKKVNRTIETLRTRAKVSSAFPADKYDRRAHPWSVYRVLARVTDIELRDEILNSKKKWTVQTMTAEVQHRLKGKLPKTDTEVINDVVSSGAFVLGGYFKWSGKMLQNGTVEVHTNTPCEFTPHDLGPGGLTIIIKPLKAEAEAAA